MPEVNLQPMYAAQAAAMDIVFGMTAKTLDAYQRLTELGMQTMKETLANNQETVRQAFAAKSPQELFALQATAVEPAAEKARAFFQQVQEIARPRARNSRRSRPLSTRPTSRPSRRYLKSLRRTCRRGPRGPSMPGRRR